MQRVEVVCVHMEQGSNTPVVLLREYDAPHRVLPIHLGGPEAASIAMALTGHVPPRPLAHDVMAELLGRLDARVDAAEVVDLRNGTFMAHLTLTGPHGPEQVDSRASDAIALAMRVGAPVYVSEAVLVAAGASPQLLVDDWFDDDFDDDLDDDPMDDDPMDDDPMADDLRDLRDLHHDRHGHGRQWRDDHLAGPALDVEVARFRAFLDLVEADDFSPGR
jgi:bifunctional DNase/RNase